MHIPENYLSPSTCGVLTAVMVPVWLRAAKRVQQTIPREKIPLLGVAAAFSFLAMMFNVPIPGGTTGHAVCGTLVAILFGPWGAVLSISIALAIQAVMFGDGGILALGANCFNMAFVLPMVGYGIYTLLMRAFSGNSAEKHVRRGPAAQAAQATAPSGARPATLELVAAGVGSYIGINAAALCAAIEFGIQPLLFSDAAGQAMYCPYPLWVSIPAMLAGHLTVAGAAEVVFTVGILAYVRKAAPSFGIGNATSCASAAPLASEIAKPAAEIAKPSAAQVRRARLSLVALLGALIVLTPLGLLATGDAWGEWATQDLAESVGYVPAGMANGWEWQSLFPDYSFGALPDWAGYVLSAVIGIALLVILFRFIAAGMKSRVDFGTR